MPFATFWRVPSYHIVPATDWTQHTHTAQARPTHNQAHAWDEWPQIKHSQNLGMDRAAAHILDPESESDEENIAILILLTSKRKKSKRIQALSADKKYKWRVGVV